MAIKNLSMNKISSLLGTQNVKFNLHTVDKGHHKVTYRGVKTIKCPFDFVIYQMIIFEIKPDLVIEIGTNNGGSALYLADLLNINNKGEIHTIDIENKIDPLALAHPRIKFFGNGYEGYDLDAAKNYETVLIIEDASHMYKDTLNALIKFGSLVTKDSYFIVEDGIVDALGLSRKFEGGPLRAIREFMKGNTDYVIDRKWCDLFGKNATFNVDGYLKKIK
jgi:cephalosporin hydroxylase